MSFPAPISLSGFLSNKTNDARRGCYQPQGAHVSTARGVADVRTLFAVRVAAASRNSSAITEREANCIAQTDRGPGGDKPGPKRSNRRSNK